MSAATKERERAKRIAPEECPGGIRVATKRDIPFLERILLDGVAAEMAFAPVNEQKVKALVAEATSPAIVADHPRAVVLIAETEDGESVGAAPILPHLWWYSESWHYVQPWLYVLKEHRKGPYARRLIEALMWWSDKAQLPMVMVSPSNEEMRPRREIYARYTKPFGGSFFHVGGMSTPTKKPDNVRVATVNDYEQIRSLCLLLSEENGMAPLMMERLDNILKRILVQSAGTIALVEDNGRIVGCTCLAFDQWDYSLSWHYGEMWVFIHPEYRTKGYAIDLIQFAKWLAEQTAIPLTCGITSIHRVPAKMRLYSKHLRQLETFFIHDGRTKS